mgnify:CR=1 FL=1
MAAEEKKGDARKPEPLAIRMSANFTGAKSDVIVRVRVDARGMPERPTLLFEGDIDLDANRLFAAWVETVYHARAHSETGQAPLARFRTAGAPALPALQSIA